MRLHGILGAVHGEPDYTTIRRTTLQTQEFANVTFSHTQWLDPNKQAAQLGGRPIVPRINDFGLLGDGVYVRYSKGPFRVEDKRTLPSYNPGSIAHRVDHIGFDNLEIGADGALYGVGQEGIHENTVALAAFARGIAALLKADSAVMGKALKDAFGTPVESSKRRCFAGRGVGDLKMLPGFGRITAIGKAGGLVGYVRGENVLRYLTSANLRSGRCVEIHWSKIELALSAAIADIEARITNPACMAVMLENGKIVLIDASRIETGTVSLITEVEAPGLYLRGRSDGLVVVDAIKPTAGFESGTSLANPSTLVQALGKPFEPYAAAA